MVKHLLVASASVVLAATLVGCSGGSGAGAIELAVAERCFDESQPECVRVASEAVHLPAGGYAVASVESVRVSPSSPSLVEVQLTEDGAQVMHDVSSEAARTGTESRMVIRVGGEMVSAVSVLEPIGGTTVTIAVRSDDEAHELAALITR